MLIALTTAHVIISLVLILMVLVQDSKGDASGLLGGGGSKSVFGATGATSFMVKATRTVAALFASCCIALAYLTSNQANSTGVFDRVQTPASRSAPVNGALDGSVPATETDSTLKSTETTPVPMDAESPVGTSTAE